MGAFQNGLIVDQTHDEHDGQAAENPINLPDVGAAEPGPVGCAVNLQHAQRTDQQNKTQEHPIKITEGDNPGHLLSPGKYGGEGV